MIVANKSEGGRDTMISNAIKLAQNEHVVYFLLTSYLAARDGDHRTSSLPDHVKRLPLAGNTDVDERLRALNEMCGSDVAARTNPPPIFREAVEVLSAASERIASLQRSKQTPLRWNVVDRTQGGHERRRRLGWRMSEREAAEWSAKMGVQLERVDEQSGN
jgi:hypothetical protein